MNLLLLCHGGLHEFRGFELQKGQSVQYRGNFGAVLNKKAAQALVQALLSDPLVTDAQIQKQIAGYSPQEPLEGPGKYQPDVDLAGDDRLLCFCLNMGTGRWVPLGSAWQSSLNEVIKQFGSAPFWLNLLCCTELGDSGVQQAIVRRDLAVKSWADILK